MLELVVLPPHDQDEQFAGEEKHDNDVVDHKDEDNGDENEAEDVAHLRLHVVAEE